jgi:hypothetical protein
MITADAAEIAAENPAKVRKDKRQKVKGKSKKVKGKSEKPPGINLNVYQRRLFTFTFLLLPFYFCLFYFPAFAAL